VTFDQASSLKSADDNTASAIKSKETTEEHGSGVAVNGSHVYRSGIDREYGGTGGSKGKLFYLEEYRSKMTHAASVGQAAETSLEHVAARYEIQQDEEEGPSEDFIMIMRSSLVKPILKCLRDVQHHAGTPNAALYINEILYSIRDLEDKSPHDPFLEVLSALYMALAYENQWADYTADQYESVGHLLRRLSRRPFPKPNYIEKAIIAMEDLGFDTTPIPISIEEDDVEASVE
jgi:hypothetical protein